MVFGTFDGLHAGHLNFLKQAKKITENSCLIVSIARDKNVKKIKGQFPRLNEQERMKLLKKCALVDKVVLAGVGNHIPHILREHPNVIALGYDQSVYVKNLKKDLKDAGLGVKIVRLKPYKASIYKNYLLNEKK
jgi:FAD synthetase